METATKHEFIEGPRDIVQNVGIVGVGTMGAGIAQVAIEAGCQVSIHDVDEAAIDEGQARIRDGLLRRAAKRARDTKSDEEGIDGQMALVHPVSSLQALVTGCDLIIECALEDLTLKGDIFRAIDQACGAKVILATNTSALSVAKIAEAASIPSRAIGLHFFNPAPLMALVEVVAPSQADPAIVARAATAMADWGKTPIVCTDRPGFIVNRVNRPYTIGALRILEAGDAGVAAIDDALRDGGFPLGPFELMDLTGIDVTFAASTAIWEGLGRPERLRPSPIQERLITLGTLGRKSGRGFYEYESGRRGALAETVRAGSASNIAPEVIRERIWAAIAVEAQLVVDEGVASRETIDVAMRLGASHPRGPFESAKA